MEITVLFVVTLLAFTALLFYDVRAAFFVAVLLYGIYPRFFSLGFGAEGFALTMQRATLFLLLGLYLVRCMWGSPEIARGWQVLARHKVLLFALLGYLLARLLGNITTGRFDLSVVGQLLNESLISIFILLLVVTYVRTRVQILLLLGVVLLSLLFNQLISVYEYLNQQPVFPADLSLSYEVGGRGDAVLAGRVRNDTFRSMGIFDNPLKLSMLLGMTLPLVIYLAANAATHLQRLIAGTSVMLAIPTAVFSGSRAGLGVVGLIFVWYGYQYVIRDMAANGRKAVLAFGIVVCATTVLVFADELVSEILFGDAYARSTEARYLAYITAPLKLVEAPLFGFGYSRNIVETLGLGALDPFVMLLALEGGATALLSFIIFLSGSIRILSPVVKSSGPLKDVKLAHALRLSLAVTLLMALVLTLSYVRMYLFLFAGLAMVLLHLHRQEQSAANAAGFDR